MGNRDDDRGRGQGWRDRDSGWSGEHASRGGGYGGRQWNGGERGEWRGGGERDYGRGGGGGGRGDDRGFFERAGEEVRSWFGGDDDDRGRYGGGGGSRDYGNDWGSGGGGGGGSGVFGVEGGSSRGGGTSGFGGGSDLGRRFDRIDPGHVGAQGAHPMSSPVGGAYGAGAGISASGGYSSSARYAAAQRQGGGQQGGAAHSISGGGLHDPHYSEWRNRQIESIDRDYEEYRREHQSRFEQDFGNWRTKRGEQRQSMGRVTEHMEVLGSDGEKIGTVDAVHGDRIVLTKNDENAGGHHHSIPCSWIEQVDEKVTVNKTREEAMREWRDEERNRALFERENQGSTGPHVLNRSFSGTY